MGGSEASAHCYSVSVSQHSNLISFLETKLLEKFDKQAYLFVYGVAIKAYLVNYLFMV